LIERDSLPVARSPSILLVRFESGDTAITGCAIVDSDICLLACAVITVVDQDPDCKAALSEDGGGGDEELGEMHFQDDKGTKSAFLEGKIERMIDSNDAGNCLALVNEEMFLTRCK
jgi:hypothetical protein